MSFGFLVQVVWWFCQVEKSVSNIIKRCPPFPCRFLSDIFKWRHRSQPVKAWNVGSAWAFSGPTWMQISCAENIFFWSSTPKLTQIFFVGFMLDKATARTNTSVSTVLKVTDDISQGYYSRAVSYECRLLHGHTVIKFLPNQRKLRLLSPCHDT